MNATRTGHQADDGSALRAILDHHSALARTLGERVDGVLDAARRRTGLTEANRALAAFLDGELLPHARAEEGALYPAAARDAHLAPLVDAMIDEHRALTERADRVRTTAGAAAEDAIAVAATAAEIRALFAVHLHKENEYLLPALVAARVDLDALLRDTHHLIDAEHERRPR